MVAFTKIKVTTAKIGGRNVDPHELGGVMGRSITASVDRGVRGLSTPMKAILSDVYEELASRHSRRWSASGLFGSRSSTRLHKRSGAGLRSIKDSISIRYTGRQGIVGSITAGTMGIHEKGGTVTAGGRYMAIPTVYAVGSRGNSSRGPRDFPRTFIHRSRRGNLFVFQRVRGDSKRVTPLFLLKKRVRIAPRLGLQEAVRRHAGYFAAKATDAMLKEIE